MILMSDAKAVQQSHPEKTKQRKLRHSLSFCDTSITVLYYLVPNYYYYIPFYSGFASQKALLKMFKNTDKM